MDDLISRKQIMDEAKRLSGPITGDGWDNWGVYALIERQPSVSAVPLDKLCEWLERYAMMYCDGCREAFGSCEDEENQEVSVCNSRERWKAMLTKWMEEQDVD